MYREYIYYLFENAGFKIVMNQNENKKIRIYFRYKVNK